MTPACLPAPLLFSPLPSQFSPSATTSITTTKALATMQRRAAPRPAQHSTLIEGYRGSDGTVEEQTTKQLSLSDVEFETGEARRRQQSGDSLSWTLVGGEPNGTKRRRGSSFRVPVFRRRSVMYRLDSLPAPLLNLPTGLGTLPTTYPSPCRGTPNSRFLLFPFLSVGVMATPLLIYTQSGLV